MRVTLDNLLGQTVGLKYTLPNNSVDIPQIAISNLPDECYNIISQENDLAEIIYNGIIEYSFDESEIDYSKLEVFKKRALINRLKFDKKATESKQLSYGFYGEILLFLMLQKFHHVGTLISRGHFYNPLESSETKGYDTYQFYETPNGELELWFGEVKFHESYYNAIQQILTKLEKSLSDDYFTTNIVAMEDYVSSISRHEIHPLIRAWQEDPEINLGLLARENNIRFVYPMLVIFDDKKKDFDDIIKEVVAYTNARFTSFNLSFSMQFSLFFMFLPVSSVHNIKALVRSWILSNQPLI